MSCWAIIAAAGSGSRMGGQQVKTLQTLSGRPVICYSVQKFAACCDGVIVMCRDEDVDEFTRVLHQEGLKADHVLPGGRDRRESVARGLQALPDDCDLVLVHDAARPLVSLALIQRVMESARTLGSGVPALKVTDTVKRVDRTGTAVETVDRQVLRTVQTPQGFHRALLESAHGENPGPASDDASLVEQLGVPVHLVEGEESNMKLTLPGDLEKAEEILTGMRLPRIGSGYDAHRLVEGYKLILCGVEIPFEKGLKGHSDADVATHAVIDALLGAAALGDIGQRFPDTQEEYRGISSLELLRRTVALLRENQLTPFNVDLTIAAQRPKLAPYMDSMRQALARALRLPGSHVSVKATTTEGMGFEGSGEGISARAVALVHTSAEQARSLMKS